MVEMRAEVVGRLKAQEEAAAPLVAFLQNASAVQDLKADKQYNLQMLNDRYQVSLFLLLFAVWGRGFVVFLMCFARFYDC